MPVEFSYKTVPSLQVSSIRLSAKKQEEPWRKLDFSRTFQPFSAAQPLADTVQSPLQHDHAYTDSPPLECRKNLLIRRH